jgi:uncharacterized protein (DUF1778 family)
MRTPRPKPRPTRRVAVRFSAARLRKIERAAQEEKQSLDRYVAVAALVRAQSDLRARQHSTERPA